MRLLANLLFNSPSKLALAPVSFNLFFTFSINLEWGMFLSPVFMSKNPTFAVFYDFSKGTIRAF